MKTGYGTKYQFEFDATCKPFSNQPLKVTKCKVLILQKDYVGAVSEIPSGQVSPVVIEYPSADDDIFYPLKGSSLSFMVLGGVINMDSIIFEDEQEYFIEYYRDNVIFWTGFITPELCEEEIFLRNPAIEFKAIDGLGTLKGKEFTTDNKYPNGIITLFTMLQNSLKLLGFDYNINVLLKMWYSTHTKTDYSTPLEQTYIFTPATKDINFEYKSNVDLLLNISYIFNCLIYQNYGEWYFVKPKDLVFGVNDASIFNTSGVLNTSQKKEIPRLLHGTDFLIIAEPKRKLRRFYKHVQIDYNLSVNKILNGDFSMWDGTPTPYTYTNTLSFIGGSQTETDFYAIDKFEGLGAAKRYLVYNQLNNNYNIAITGSNSNEGYYLRGVRIADPEGFTLNLDCITGNPRFAVIATQVVYLGGQPVVDYKSYNFEEDEWVSFVPPNGTIYKYIMPSEFFNPGEGIYNVSLNFKRPDFFVDPYKKGFYTVGVILYPEIRIGFNGFESFYSKVCINGIAPEIVLDDSSLTGNHLKLSKEILKTDNYKKASITPDPIEVFNGDAFYYNGVKYSDDSNLKVLVGGNYVSTSYPYKNESNVILDGWKERDEDEQYSVMELCARNTLSQYSDYRNIFTGTLIGKNLQYGAIYEFPNQGVLGGKKFFPLSIKLNERDCTADVVLMELSPNEITGQMSISRYDVNGNLVLAEFSPSKPPKSNGLGTDLGEAGSSFQSKIVTFFMDDFKP
jgi:hypothetical protein